MYQVNSLKKKIFHKKKSVTLLRIFTFDTVTSLTDTNGESYACIIAIFVCSQVSGGSNTGANTYNSFLACFTRMRNERTTRGVEEAVLTQHGSSSSAVLQGINSGGCRSVKSMLPFHTVHHTLFLS